MRTSKTFACDELDGLFVADREHPHIHSVDLPYRVASIWQDHGCEIGIWEQNGQVIAWAVFQPAWWNLDYAVLPAYRGFGLEQEIFSWGQAQMRQYASQAGETFWGSVEIFEDTPQAAQTIHNLEAVGFKPFDWSIFRFELDLSQEFHSEQLPPGYRIRPMQGTSEIQVCVDLHRAAFVSERMTIAWRQRILQQPRYRPELDLLVENQDRVPVGFCLCWVRADRAQIEPLGVHPDYQGRGLAKALEEAAFRILSGQGVRTLQVDHGSYNESAIAVSRKTGFRKCNNALRYYCEVMC